MKLLSNTQKYSGFVWSFGVNLSGHRLEFSQPGGLLASLHEILAHGQAPRAPSVYLRVLLF